MKVVLSEHNLKIKEGFEQVFNVSKIFMHNFSYKTFNNDIMLIKVGCHFKTTSAAPDTQFMSVRQKELFVCVCVLCVCVPAERASAAQCQHSASFPAWWTHPPTYVWHLHSERLGCDTDLQLLPVPCLTGCGREDSSFMQLLLLGDDQFKHGVCRISDGWQGFLPGTHSNFFNRYNLSYVCER